jgi:protein ImuB
MTAPPTDAARRLAEAAARATATAHEAPVWPGAVPPPAPAQLAPTPVAAEVVDGDGAPVGVTGRGLATADPARLRVGTGRWVAVEAWAGPWPVEERWWDPATTRRRARLQVVDADGVARLLALEGGRWWVLATYD